MASIVERHAQETESLEFKQAFWKNEKDASGRVASFAKEQASKDVAVLANALGGDFLGGRIVEDRCTGTAARFSDPEIPSDPWKDDPAG